jgi:hypothetical protein
MIVSSVMRLINMIGRQYRATPAAMDHSAVNLPAILHVEAGDWRFTSFLVILEQDKWLVRLDPGSLRRR